MVSSPSYNMLHMYSWLNAVLLPKHTNKASQAIPLCCIRPAVSTRIPGGQQSPASGYEPRLM